MALGVERSPSGGANGPGRYGAGRPSLFILVRPAMTMGARFETLLERVRAEEPLHIFSRAELVEALEDQEGHVGRTLNRLRLRAHNVTDLSQLPASAPKLRRRAPSPKLEREEDSLDAFVHDHVPGARIKSSSAPVSRINSASLLRPSAGNFSARVGKPKNLEYLQNTTRRQEERLAAQRGPGSYNPVNVSMRRNSMPIISPPPASHLLVKNGCLVKAEKDRSAHPGPGAYNPVHVASRRASVPLITPLPASDVLESWMRRFSSAPPPPASLSRPAGPSSPRKRSHRATPQRRTIERLH